MGEQLPFYAYKGDKPYIFISYSHRDSEKVFSIIRKFNDSGYRIWYDEGIDPGNEWPEEIGTALSACALFVVFISPRSAISENVRNEINFALAKKLPVIVIHLEETELTAGMQLQIGAKQAIMKYNMTDEAFYYKCDKSFERIGLTREEVVENNTTTPVIALAQTNISFEIPENALRFEPKGTAVITLKNKTQYTVSANAIMFYSRLHDYYGLYTGLIYKTDLSYSGYRDLPFTEIKNYKPFVALSDDDNVYAIVRQTSPLYIIDTETKRDPVKIDMEKLDRICVDIAHAFDSVSGYALIERIDDVPLLVPSASIFLEVSWISEFRDIYKDYQVKIPFENKESVSINSILIMEITNVLHAPDNMMDLRCHVNITITKTNMEMVSDEIDGCYTLTALTHKGLMHLGFDKIKKVTFM
jgi:hypothetical protein